LNIKVSFYALKKIKQEYEIVVAGQAHHVSGVDGLSFD